MKNKRIGSIVMLKPMHFSSNASKHAFGLNTPIFGTSYSLAGMEVK
jgi:hypothetical protein